MDCLKTSTDVEGNRKNPWADFLGLGNSNDFEYYEPSTEPRESCVSKLPFKDMVLYGLHPFDGESFMSKCSYCGKILKTHVLNSHIDKHKREAEENSLPLHSSLNSKSDNSVNLSVNSDSGYWWHKENFLKKKRKKVHNAENSPEAFHVKVERHRTKHTSSPYVKDRLASKKTVQNELSHGYSQFTPSNILLTIPNVLLPTTSSSSYLLPSPSSESSASSDMSSSLTNQLFSQYTNLYTFNSSSPSSVTTVQVTTTNNFLPSAHDHHLSTPATISLPSMSTYTNWSGSHASQSVSKKSLPILKKSLTAKKSTDVSGCVRRDAPSGSVYPTLIDMRASETRNLPDSSQDDSEKKAPALEKLVLRRGVKGDAPKSKASRDTYFMVVNKNKERKKQDFLAATQQIKKESNEAHQQNDIVQQKMKDLESIRDALISQLFQELQCVKQKLHRSLLRISDMQKEITELKSELAVEKTRNDTLKMENAELRELVEHQHNQLNVSPSCSYLNAESQMDGDMVSQASKQQERKIAELMEMISFFKVFLEEMRLLKESMEKHAPPEIYFQIQQSITARRMEFANRRPSECSEMSSLHSKLLADIVSVECEFFSSPQTRDHATAIKANTSPDQ